MKATGYILFVYIMLVISFEKTMGANIIYISLTPSPSHNIWDKTIAMALRQRGHNITYVSHFNVKCMENFTTIFIEGTHDKMEEEFNYKEMVTMSPLESVYAFFDYLSLICEESAKSKGIQQLLEQVENKVQYDLIMYDMTVGQCFYPFIEKFNWPPVVATSPFGVAPFHSFIFGNDVDASFIPLYVLPYTEQMTFYERLNNYLYTMFFQFWRKYIFMPQQWKLAQNLFGTDIRPYEEIERNVSFLLANYDPNFDYPRSLPPAIIPVGGLHTNRETSLAKDLKEYLDNARDGVILFSLGTNLRSDSMEKDKIDELIKGFSQLKQTVLWKFETDISKLPKNVIVRPWLPQNDILAHPNVKLFITHGGALSTQEAIYHAIPMIGIPFFADQHVNMQKIISRELGLKLDYLTLTAEKVVDTVNEVLNNPTYKRTVQEVSNRYRDQPEDALTRAVFWIEYVMRHGSGQHLRIAPRDMPAYQVYYLDIWAVIIIVVVTIIYAVRNLYSILFKHETKLKLKAN